MAYSFKITDGTEIGTFEVIYDASTQANYKLRYGMSVRGEEPEVLQHIPDYGEPVLVRANNKDRTVFLSMHVKGTSWNDVINRVAALKRMVDGADSQAVRYWQESGTDSVNRVVLRIQLNGATNYTDVPIKWGHVDDSGAFYTTDAIANTNARNVMIMLRVSAYGEGASFTLDNKLVSSPHFIEDTDSDGLADGWNKVLTPATTIDTSDYLIGSQSQSVQCTGADEGIESDTISSVNGWVIAYIWVAPISGSFTNSIQIYNKTDSLIVAKKDLDTTDSTTYDMTLPGEANVTTWYRVFVLGNVSGPKNISLRVMGGGAADLFVVDAAYLRTGVDSLTTPPSGWCSYPSVYNRYDPSTAEADINYLDFWGIMGDAPPLINLKLTASSLNAGANPKYLYLNKLTDGKFKAADYPYWIETDSLDTTTSGGSWTNPSDATVSGGAYRRFTSTGAASSATIVYAPTGQDSQIFCTRDWRVFARIKGSNSGHSWQLASPAAGTGVEFDTNVVTGVSTSWEFHDLGIVYTAGLIKPGLSAGDLTSGGPSFAIQVIDVDNTETADIDTIILLGTTGNDDMLLLKTGTSKFIWSTTSDLIIDGAAGGAYVESTGRINDVVGGVKTVLPGPKMTRIVAHESRTTNDRHTLTDAWAYTITVTPRVRHLLGVA